MPTSRAVASHYIASHYSQCNSAALELVGRYEGFVGTLSGAVERIRTEAEEAGLTLAQAYLLELNKESLEGAERRTGFRGFTRTDPLAAMARETQVLQKRVKAIEADERYSQRQLLVGAEGVLHIELAERQSMLDPWEEELAKYESLEGFIDLVDVGYDTPGFTESWWQKRYWAHWKQGDEICAALGMDDFGDDVLPAYLKVRDKRNEWFRQVAETEAKIKDVHDLTQEHDAALARLPKMSEIYLEACQTRLSGYLLQADLQLLDQWNDDDPAGDRGITMGIRMLSGLQAKESFITELRGQGLDPFMQDLRSRAQKYRRKTAKFQRGKYLGMTWDESYMDLRFLSEKVPKYEARIGKLERLVAKILDYDDYGRFDLKNDPNLWWVEFTGKRPPTLTPRLRAWYDRNPSVDVTHDRDFMDDDASAIAVAAAAQDGYEQEGYLS